MNARLQVILYIAPGEPPCEAAIEITEGVLREAYRPLDLASRTADGFSRMICTPQTQVTTVIKLRENLAKDLAARVSEALIQILSSRDTIMGYSVEKN